MHRVQQLSSHVAPQAAAGTGSTSDANVLTIIDNRSGSEKRYTVQVTTDNQCDTIKATDLKQIKNPKTGMPKNPKPPINFPK